MINFINVLLSCAAKGYAVKDVVEGIEYEFRVAAINNSGAGEFSTPSEFIFARDPKSKQTCTKTMTVLTFSEQLWDVRANLINFVLQNLQEKSQT